MHNYKYWITGIVAIVCILTLLAAKTGLGSSPLINKNKQAKFANRQVKQGKIYAQALSDYQQAMRLKQERFAQMKKRREDSLKTIAHSYNNSYGGGSYGNNDDDYEYEVYYTPAGVRKTRRVGRRNRGYYAGNSGGYDENRQSRRTKTGSLRGQTSRSFRGGSRRGGK